MMSKDIFVTVQYSKSTGLFKLDFLPGAIDTKIFTIHMIEAAENSDIVLSSFFVNPDSKKVSKPDIKIITKPGIIVNPKSIYGLLYTYPTIMNPLFCPPGWHIPTHQDYLNLIGIAGGEYGSGNNLREIGALHWLAPNSLATDSLGFTAIGAGRRYLKSTFAEFQMTASFWKSHELYADTPSSFEVLFDSDYCLDRGCEISDGNSVRLVKDDNAIVNTLVDIEGNEYDVINANGKCWTKNNFKCKKLTDGSNIPDHTLLSDWTGSVITAFCYVNGNSNLI